MLTELKTALGAGSNDVTFGIYGAETAQAAHALEVLILPAPFQRVGIRVKEEEQWGMIFLSSSKTTQTTKHGLMSLWG